MSEPQLLVIEHEADAHARFFGERLSAAGVRLTTVGPERAYGPPLSLEGYHGLLVLGGAMGPLDDEIAPWLPQTRALLAEGVQRQIPTLGICLGYQLLTVALGGSVAPVVGQPETGVFSLRVSATAAEDPLFRVLAGREVPAMGWHYLEARSLPDRAMVLASSEECERQIVRFGPSAWGVQFHPEAMGDAAREWAMLDAAGLEALGRDAREIERDARANEAGMRVIWGSLAERFAGLVTQQARQTASSLPRPSSPVEPSVAQS